MCGMRLESSNRSTKKDVVARKMQSLAERRKTIRDSEEKNDADGATVNCTSPRNQVIETWMVAARLESAAHRSRHKGVHRNEAEGKCCQAQHSARCAAQIGSEEKQCQLRRRFRANAVQHAD